MNDSYFIYGFSTKAKTDCLYFDISRFIIRCRYKVRRALCLPEQCQLSFELIQTNPDGVSTYRMPAVKSNRPVNLSMGQVLAVN